MGWGTPVGLPLGEPVKVGFGVVVIAGAVKLGLGVVVTDVAPGDTVPVTRGVPVPVTTVPVPGTTVPVTRGVPVPVPTVPVGAGMGAVGVVTGWPGQKPALRYLQSK